MTRRRKSIGFLCSLHFCRQTLLTKKQDLRTLLKNDIVHADPGQVLLDLCIYEMLSKDNVLLCAPGKLVPTIMQYFKSYLLKSDDNLLSLFMDASTIVSNYIVAKRAQKASIQEQEKMNKILNELKEIVLKGKGDSTPVTPLSAAITPKQVFGKKANKDEEQVEVVAIETTNVESTNDTVIDKQAFDEPVAAAPAAEEEDSPAKSPAAKKKKKGTRKDD